MVGVRYIAGVHGVDAEASTALGHLGGVEALDGLGVGFALFLGNSDSGNRYGFNGVDGIVRRFDFGSIEDLGLDGDAVHWADEKESDSFIVVSLVLVFSSSSSVFKPDSNFQNSSMSSIFSI